MAIKINHLAIWVKNLEQLKDFYIKYFDMTCGERYHNPTKKFTSYFLSFRESDVRIELMHREDISDHPGDKGATNGFTHFAISVGSKDSVDALTERLRADNYMIASEPRTTGDGYYESVILDPEDNRIEITE